MQVHIVIALAGDEPDPIIAETSFQIEVILRSRVANAGFRVRLAKPRQCGKIAKSIPGSERFVGGVDLPLHLRRRQFIMASPDRIPPSPAVVVGTDMPDFAAMIGILILLIYATLCWKMSQIRKELSIPTPGMVLMLLIL